MWVYLSLPQRSIYILYIWKEVCKKSLHLLISFSLSLFFFFWCVCLYLKTASNQWFLSCKSLKIQASVVHPFSVTNRWCPPAQSFAGSRIVFEKSKCVTYREKVKLLSQSVVPDSATPWTVAHQAPLSLGFSRQEYLSGMLLPSPGNLRRPRDRT